METFYTLLGIATFWAITISIIIGLIIMVFDEIKLCLEVRRNIKHQILTGIFYKSTNGGSCWVSNDYVSKETLSNIKPITWKDHYNLSWWAKLWMIGL